MIPPVPNLKDKLKQTSLRMHLEKDEKKIALTKLALVGGNNKEGFLPKI